MMNPNLFARLMARRQQRGFSLIELMIAVTIGLLITLALSALFLNITRNNSELSKVNSQIENGRFALQILETDLVHAGFWGELSPAAATAVPADPCLAVAFWNAAFKANMLGMPVMGYDSATVPATCDKVTGALADGDVLMVRHANTCTAGSANCDGGTDTGPHIQVSACTTTPEAAYVIDSTTFPLRQKDCSTIAARRKVVTNIYYLATSNGQPTLMRVSLANGAYQIAQPLIEGIEALRFEYGIDTLGKNGLAISATNPGDGSPDEFKTSSELASASGVVCDFTGTACDLAANIVAVKTHVLARSLEKSPGYTDSKTYQLGSTSYTVPTADAGYKRHVFSTTIRLVNPSGRRE